MRLSLHQIIHFLFWFRLVACWKAEIFLHAQWWFYLHRKLRCISLQNLRIVSVMDGYGWIEVLNIKNNEFAMLLFVYALEPVNDVFFIFPLIQVKLMSKLFVHCLYLVNLLNLSISFLAEFISRTDGLFWNFLY